MAKKKWTDIGIGVLLIVLAMKLYADAREFPLGADLFPKTILVAIGVLAALMVITAQKRQPGGGGGQKPSTGDALRPFLLFGCCLGYLALILTTGFFPATIVIGFAFMAILQVKKKRLYLGIFGGTLLFIYILFAWFLAVPLPRGILWG